MRLRALTLALPLVASGLAAQSATEIQSELRAKEIERQLAAIDRAAGIEDKAVQALLPPLLRDKDWEIQERAAEALGKAKNAAALAKLVDVAIDGDVVRVRRAAALAAAEIDATAAAAAIFKKCKSKTVVPALEALALVLRKRPQFTDADDLQKLMSDEDPAVREAAAAAWLEAAADRPAALKKLCEARSLILQCRALDTVAAAPRAEDLTPLIALLRGGSLAEVTARRTLRATAALLARSEGDRAATAKVVLEQLVDDESALLRRARLVPMLTTGTTPVLPQKQAVELLKPCLSAKGGAVRAAAAKALRAIGGEDALAAALQRFANEPDGNTQWQLIETVTALRPSNTKEAADWLLAIVTSDRLLEVRERAVVRLGRSGVPDATTTLVKQFGDRHWRLACCAIVSLGKTDADDALPHLLGLLKDQDWKRRGAAVVGLMHWSRDAAVDPLLEMLDDKHPIVARAAHEALRTMSRHYDAKPNAKAWRAWWTEHRATHDFTDREASLDKLKKYGYAVPDSEIYQGLDVVVFESRGDHIEQVLDRLEIAHRKTSAGQVLACGMHPEAIFVSNCTGELQPDDLEPLTWFVVTGGSLFGSCWALSETIARIHPGVMQKAQTPDQVLDDVRAAPVDPDSPLLNGVFPPSVVPIYHLEGAHLIDVLDQERCEVLIDSPDAAERHGCGNLAAWFFSGHGVLFDSANHFDLQGLAVAPGIKTPGDRQAYAVDHMGMSFATWRRVRSEGYWKNATKARESVPDLSAFRLLTNFVRSKRSAEY